MLEIGLPGVAIGVGDAPDLGEIAGFGGVDGFGQGLLEGAGHLGYRFAQLGVHSALALEFTLVIGLQALGLGELFGE